MLRIIKIASLGITTVLVAAYIDYFIAVLNYPNNIFLDEGILSRISLSIIEHGLKFTTLDVYPHILTMYGFLYELVCVPLFWFMEPSVNCGRYITFASSLAVVVLIYKILRKLGLSVYLSIVLSTVFLLFKPTAAFGCYSKSETFATLLTFIVVYSLYFHRGNKQFIVTLIFSVLALTTKQTTAFIVAVVVAYFILQEPNRKQVLRALTWLLSFVLIFAVLFLAIPNYFYNTVTLTFNMGTQYTSFDHLLFGQIFPLVRATIFFGVILLFAIMKNGVGFREFLTPSALYVLFYIPIFLLTSYSTASEPVYFFFVFAGLSVLLGETIVRYKLSENLLINVCVLLQLGVFLLYPSKNYIAKITYNKPTVQMKTEAAEIESIIKNAGVERSFVTFSWSSFGLSRKSSNNLFDFKLGYLAESGKLDLQPYMNDFNSKKFSVVVGGLDLPYLHDALIKNYYLYKRIGDTPIYFPYK